jgi:hypothetical protein
MTGALVIYAATFMRYSLAVTPPNYLLFACHLTNFGAQSTQAYRYLNYWKYVTPQDKAVRALSWSCHYPRDTNTNISLSSQIRRPGKAARRQGGR